MAHLAGPIAGAMPAAAPIMIPPQLLPQPQGPSSSSAGPVASVWSQTQAPGVWQDPSNVKECHSCKSSFGFMSTKRHCRRCGLINCDPCTSIHIPLPPMHMDPVPICKTCWTTLASANAAAVNASVAPMQQNIAVLQSLFPDVGSEVIQDLLLLQQNNLAKCIEFLQGGKSNSSKAGTVAEMKEESEMVRHLSADGKSAPPVHPCARVVKQPSIHDVALDRNLTQLQKQFFYAHGFLHLTGVVQKDMISAALYQINQSMGKGINVADYHRPNDAKERAANKHPTFCPDVNSHPSLVNCLKLSAIPKLIESLMGVGSFNLPGSCQIALTFPNGDKCGLNNPGGVNAAMVHWSRPENYSKHWHIDGIHRKSNGFANDEIKNFTLLCGIYLSEAPQDFSGNIAVYPGSHHALEDYFRQVDPIVRLVDESLPPIPLNKPHQLHVQPGDVLLAHYQTAHTVTPNFSPNVRYALYFRIIHSSRPSWNYSHQCMTNIWTEYAGIKDIHFEHERARMEKEKAEREQREKFEREQQRKAMEEADRIAALELQRQWNAEAAAAQQQQQHPYAQPVAPAHQQASFFPPASSQHIPYAVPIAGPVAAGRPYAPAAQLQQQQQHYSVYPGMAQPVQQPQQAMSVQMQPMGPSSSNNPYAPAPAQYQKPKYIQ